MVNMILAKDFDGELWVKAADYHQEVERAVKVEREACAKVCEDWTRTPETTGMELSLCATAIRAREKE